MPFLEFKPRGVKTSSFDAFVVAIKGTDGIPELAKTMTRLFLTQSVSFVALVITCSAYIDHVLLRQGDDCTLTDEDCRMLKRVCRSRILHTPPLVAEFYYGYV